MNRMEQLSEIDYHNHSAVGSTGIKEILSSVGKYKRSQTIKKERTKAMNFGTALHLAVLEPKRFKAEVIAMPKFSGTGMYAKKDQFLTEHNGKIIITEDELADVHGMLKMILKHKTAPGYLVGGIAEQSYFWDFASQECKCRPDYLQKNGTLVDIKTTTNASEEEFSRTILNYGYHISAQHYLNGVGEVAGRKLTEFLIIAIEKEEPYAVRVFKIDEGSLDKGQTLITMAMNKLAKAKKENYFPYYPEGVTSIGIPAYGFQQYTWGTDG